MSRCCAVAGIFYEDIPENLERQVRNLLGTKREQRKAIGLLAPHAGYHYSGQVAGEVYGRIIIPKYAIILSPNHTGLGPKGSVSFEDKWEIPGHEIEVARDLAEKIVSSCPFLEVDETAHAEEHGIEVHLPFLVAKNPDVKIVPICLKTMPYHDCEALGVAIGDALQEIKEDVVIIASSDMTHHEPLKITVRKDRMALDRIISLDPKGLFYAVVDHHISMCGFVACVVMLSACLNLGARRAEIVSYTTSGMVNNDYSSVVGYAGVVVTAGRYTPSSLVLLKKDYL